MGRTKGICDVDSCAGGTFRCTYEYINTKNVAPKSVQYATLRFHDIYLWTIDEPEYHAIPLTWPMAACHSPKEKGVEFLLVA